MIDLLDIKLRKLLKEKQIHLLPSADLHGKAFYYKVKNISFITYDENLSECELEEAIIHELGHYFNDDKTMQNYLYDSRVRCRSERGANAYLIESYAKKYVEDVDKDNANYLSLANFLNLKDVDMVKDILTTIYKVQN